MTLLLKDYLALNCSNSDVVKIILTLSEAGREIAAAIHTAHIGAAGSCNVYGEEQMALDVLAEAIISKALKSNSAVGLIASEELDEEQKIGDGVYGVCYDPLDGSSLVDVNLAVGSIFAVYETKTFVGVKGLDMKAAGFLVYGPRTTLVCSWGNGVLEATLQDGEFVISKENLKVGAGKMFAPGNLRIVKEHQAYLKLVEYWMNEEYTLRYSGGMVADVNQILLKEKGIFTYPGSPSNPEGKLRLLFECAPMAYLMEQAGGAASDGKERILEKAVQKISQRTPILVGSREEVERAKVFLL